MTGDSSHSLYPKDWLLFTSEDCSNKEDTLYQTQCRLLIARFLYDLHTGPKAEERWSHFKTEKTALAAWFGLWENEAAKKFGKVDRNAKRKLQLYGVIGACMIRTYWTQNCSLKPPKSVFAHSKKHKHPHPHGGDEIKQSIHEIRNVPITWIRSLREDLVYGSKLRQGYEPVVPVIYKFNAWEYIPDIEFRRDYVQLKFEKKYRREDEGFRNMILISAKLWEDTICVRTLWLYKQVYGAWPIAVVNYHVLTGLSVVCWTKTLPKVLKQTELRPDNSKRKRRGKGEDQYNFAFSQPLHPHPFAAVKVERKVELDVPWSEETEP